MRSRERLLCTVILCLTLLAAVWLHGMLNRYVVIPQVRDEVFISVKYDRITGRVWVIAPVANGIREITEAVH
jgi:hypothetical protein